MELPPTPSGVPLPAYSPLGPQPRQPVRWVQAKKKMAGWLDHHRPGDLRGSSMLGLVQRNQLVRWSKPVWLWFEGRDGLFLTISSFLIVDQGYLDGPDWHERGAFYLYLGTHAWVQLHGPAALSLCPRAELDTLCEVTDLADWQRNGVIWTGVAARPDCYVAPRALPWRSGVGSVVTVFGTDKRKRVTALKAIQEVAERYVAEHASPEAARATLLQQLWVAENKPCEAVRREAGWWNQDMQKTFLREAPPVFGQPELLPLENWQLFAVDPRTGAWIPR